MEMAGTASASERAGTTPGQRDGGARRASRPAAPEL